MGIDKLNFAFGEVRYGPVYMGSIVPLRVTVVVTDYDVMMNLREKAILSLPPETRYEIRKREPRNLTQPIVMRWVREKKMDDMQRWIDSDPKKFHSIFSKKKNWCLLARFTTPKEPKPYLRIVK